MFWNKESKDLKERNAELEKEIAALKDELAVKTDYIEYIRGTLAECESLKDEWKQAIAEAKIAKNNFEELYSAFLKFTRED